MARVKQPYDEERYVPGSVNRMVKPGETVELPDSELASYLESGWQPGDKDTKALAEKLRKEAEAAEQQEQGATPGANGEEQTR